MQSTDQLSLRALFHNTNKLQALEKDKEKKDLQNAIDIDDNKDNLLSMEGHNIKIV
jgi:hypothetical protein